ncbi:hypothetical protein IW152_003636 [Coemansia sp. BCRC 34962]|nr:hypothetical protein IW152_003636 [Coemansia sp. BCRC 34962]
MFVYILFITFFTCPSSPDHFVCRTESLAYSTLVTPIHNYLLSTETGSRVHTAYNAHLVPFYEKHAVPVVDATHAFVSDTARPALCRATKPACDAILRVVEPHKERVVAAYDQYLGPVVEATGGAVGKVVNGWLLPVVNKVWVWVVPRVSSAVSDHLVPFFRDTVMPRWNGQVKPALCRYSRIVVQYTRSEILPAIADGAGRAYVVSRDFAAVHVVPHAKRATVYSYLFMRKHVLPPINRVYEQNLKEYVDRVVPWEQVSRVGGGVWVFVKGFVEEFYFMCYTIATGDEHPLVVARMKVVEKVEVKTEDVGQLQGLAKKVSGSARQWIQAARGWIGEAKNSYESRIRATVDSQKSQITKDVLVAKSTASAPAAATPAFAKTTVSTPAAATPVAVPTVSTPAAVTPVPATPAVDTPAATTPADTETAAPTPAVAEVYHAESLSTEEDIPVIATKDIAKRPGAHVASFVGVDTEDIVEPVAEASASTMLPAAKLTEEDVPAVEYMEDTVLSTIAVEEPVAEQEEQTPAADDEPPVVSNPVPEPPAVMEEEPVAEQLPTDVPAVDELPPVLISEPSASIAETTAEIPAPAIDIAEKPVLASEPIISVVETPVAIPEPALSAVETPEAASDPVIRIVEAPVVVLDRVIEAPVIVPEPAISIAETPMETLAPAAPPAAVTSKEEEPVLPTAEHETTSLMAETTSFAPLGADDAASIIYEARDVMAGVLVSDDERAVFDDLVKSANKVAEGAEKLEQFPSVLNDLEGTVAEETPPVAPFVPQTTVPPTASGLVDEDVRKAASNWVKDARESISKELAQERTRSGTLDEAEVMVDNASADEPVVPVAETTAPAEPRRVPVVEKPADLPTRPTTLAAVAKPPAVEEKIESVKRLKKPAVDTAGEATTKGPRKVKKTKKRVVKKNA